MRRLVAAFCLLLAAWVVVPTAHAGDGRLGWYTIESEHFIVSYHDPLHGVARRVALVAERAHEVLAPAMGHVPEEKTTQPIAPMDLPGSCRATPFEFLHRRHLVSRISQITMIGSMR